MEKNVLKLMGENIYLEFSVEVVTSLSLDSFSILTQNFGNSFFLLLEKDTLIFVWKF